MTNKKIIDIILDNNTSAWDDMQPHGYWINVGDDDPINKFLAITPENVYLDIKGKIMTGTDRDHFAPAIIGGCVYTNSRTFSGNTLFGVPKIEWLQKATITYDADKVVESVIHYLEKHSINSIPSVSELASDPVYPYIDEQMAQQIIDGIKPALAKKADKIVKAYINDWFSEFSEMGPDWVEHTDPGETVIDIVGVPSVERILELNQSRPYIPGAGRPNIDADMAKKIVDGINRRVIAAQDELDWFWHERYKELSRSGEYHDGGPEYWKYYSWEHIVEYKGDTSAFTDYLYSDTIDELKAAWAALRPNLCSSVVSRLDKELEEYFPNPGTFNALYDGFFAEFWQPSKT